MCSSCVRPCGRSRSGIGRTVRLSVRSGDAHVVGSSGPGLVDPPRRRDRPPSLGPSTGNQPSVPFSTPLDPPARLAATAGLTWPGEASEASLVGRQRAGWWAVGRRAGGASEGGLVGRRRAGWWGVGGRARRRGPGDALGGRPGAAYEGAGAPGTRCFRASRAQTAPPCVRTVADQALEGSPEVRGATRGKSAHQR